MRGLPDYPFSPRVKIHRIPAGRPHVHNYETPNLENLLTSVAFSFGVVLLLLRHARRFDVIHFHGASLPLLIVLPFAKLLRIPLLALVAATHQGVEAGDMRKHPLVGFFLAWAFARVDGYIAITAEVERLLAAEGVPGERIARVPFFVDVETFKPLPPKERAQVRSELGLGDRTVVVHSGRLVPRKGGDVLIRAFARASAKARMSTSPPLRGTRRPLWTTTVRSPRPSSERTWARSLGGSGLKVSTSTKKGTRAILSPGTPSAARRRSTSAVIAM